MIHFNLISATDLTKFGCTSYVKIIPQMEGVANSEPYSITEKSSKKKDPKYNHEIDIPFYCLNSLDLLFFQKKLGKDKSIGKAIIPFTLETFLLPQPQTTDIKLYEPFNDACPTVKFSISYYPIYDLFVKPIVDPKRVYVYLTYDPPLQPNTQEVDLICKGLDNNGTIYDPSISRYVVKEKVPARCGPSGLTQVYYFDHEKIKQGKFFFYIKSVSYTGKVSLNFATAPEKVSLDNHNEYFLIDNPHSIFVNHKETVFSLFPIKFLFLIESVSISQIEMGPIEYIVQGTPNKIDQHPTNDGFIELYNYFALNPVGIAEWSIIFAGSISLLFPNERIQSYRFEIEAGNKYSLTNAFKFNRITEFPKEIFIAMSYKTTGASLYFHALSCSSDGSNISSFNLNGKSEPNRPVHFISFLNPNDLNSQVPSFSKDFTSLLKTDKVVPENDITVDQKRICIEFDKIDKSVKFIALIATSGTKMSHTKNGGLLIRQIWDDASCRIADNLTGKEVMCFKVPQHTCPCGILLTLLVRKDEDNWEVWPCNKIFKSRPPCTTNLSDNEQSCVENFSNFFTKGEINELFRI